MVNFGNEISFFRLCFTLLLRDLNWSYKKSTTYHFARILQNTSVFNPEIEVRSITGNIVSFYQRTVSAVSS